MLAANDNVNDENIYHFGEEYCSAIVQIFAGVMGACFIPSHEPIWMNTIWIFASTGNKLQHSPCITASNMMHNPLYLSPPLLMQVITAVVYKTFCLRSSGMKKKETLTEEDYGQGLLHLVQVLETSGLFYSQGSIENGNDAKSSAASNVELASWIV